MSNEELVSRIRDVIRKRGRITFAEFMEAALYDPDYGYYTSGREKVGIEGDYLTAPEMHPGFGACVAEWIAERWREMGSPEQFDVVEMGAGKGLLCLSAVTHIRESAPGLYEAVRYRVVEAGSSPRGMCPVEEGRVEAVGSLSDIPDDSVTGCFISNELVDAFPVHLVTVDGGRLREIYVTLRDDQLVEEIGEPSTEEIPAYFQRLGITLPDEYRTEVNLQALSWMREVAEKLREGFVLTIDYGYTANTYYHPERRRGTLLTYYRHAYEEDPYIRIGYQDITAHVDFTTLQDAGQDAGLVTASFTTQRDFLLAHGIERFISTPESRRAIMALIDPKGMGGFRILIQRRSGYRMQDT